MSLFRITDAASLGLHAMHLLALQPDKRLSVPDIAHALNVSPNHMSKVAQRLAKAGLITAYRGPQGGLQLTRSPESIRLVEIYRAVEGELAPNDCLLGRPACPRRCILGDMVRSVNRTIRDYFEQTTLADIAREE